MSSSWERSRSVIAEARRLVVASEKRIARTQALIGRSWGALDEEPEVEEVEAEVYGVDRAQAVKSAA